MYPYDEDWLICGDEQLCSKNKIDIVIIVFFTFIKAVNLPVLIKEQDVSLFNYWLAIGNIHVFLLVRVLSRMF